MPIIANKLAFYTDSIGHYPPIPAVNLAANVCAKLVGVTYDAQQLGEQSMVHAYNGQFNNGAPNWLGGLNMPQHTDMIQADTIVLHLGGNDADPFMAGTSSNLFESPVRYLTVLYGQNAAASGRKIAVVEAPAVVMTDSPLWATDPDAVRNYRDGMNRLQQIRESAVAEINSLYPGAAKIIYYRAPNAIAPVTMNPGSTVDGLHPKEAKHMEIAHSIATELGAWRGWSVLP